MREDILFFKKIGNRFSKFLKDISIIMEMVWSSNYNPLKIVLGIIDYTNLWFYLSNIVISLLSVYKFGNGLSIKKGIWSFVIGNLSSIYLTAFNNRFLVLETINKFFGKLGEGLKNIANDIKLGYYILKIKKGISKFITTFFLQEEKKQEKQDEVIENKTNYYIGVSIFVICVAYFVFN